MKLKEYIDNVAKIKNKLKERQNTEADMTEHSNHFELKFADENIFEVDIIRRCGYDYFDFSYNRAKDIDFDVADIRKKLKIKQNIESQIHDDCFWFELKFSNGDILEVDIEKRGFNEYIKLCYEIIKINNEK